MSLVDKGQKKMAAAIAALALLAATCDAMSFDTTYGQGIIHYRDEQWEETVSTMQKAASEYSEYTLALEVCVDACTSKEPSLPVDYPPEPQLHWFHSLIERASCLQSCMAKEGWAGDGGTSEEVCSELKRGEPYNYLQMSLWNVRLALLVHHATHTCMCRCVCVPDAVRSSLVCVPVHQSTLCSSLVHAAGLQEGGKSGCGAVPGNEPLQREGSEQHGAVPLSRGGGAES